MYCLKSSWFNVFISILALNLSTKNTILSRIYSLSFVIFLSLIFCFQMHGRISTNFETNVPCTNRTIIIGTSNTVIILVCNVVITLPALFHKKKLKNEILNELKHIDETLSKYLGDFQEEDDTVFMIHSAILNIFYILLISNDILSYILDNSFINAEFYSFDQLYRYRIAIFVLYIYNLLKQLSRRITATNTVLNSNFAKASSNNLNGNNNLLKELEELIQDVSFLHSKFSSIVKSFNNIFGWSLLFVFLNYIFLFMVTYETGLRIASTGYRNWYIYLWFSSSMLYSAIIITLVMTICHLISKEASKIADASYCCLYKLDLRHQNDILAQNLTSLLRQSRNNEQIKFTAAGFFPVNYSTFFMLINLLTSYLIVLIQF